MESILIKVNENLFNKIELTNFSRNIPESQLIKIFDRGNRKVNWKYKITDNLKVSPFKIIELVEYTCVTRVFVNLYKYTSTHTYTGFISIEHFEKMRGKQVSDEYVNPLVTNAIILTLFLIKDICTIDTNAEKTFSTFSDKNQKDIIGINKALRKT